MWKYWTCGILGVWIVIMPYLGFPWEVHRILIVVTGIVIATLSFWLVSEKKIQARHNNDEPNEPEKTF
ncbi:hypothetical protein A2926_03220 [Candidatus Giovannonibacteria bacterium RIFCSPLOWO2_01_FULL_44_40]|uniref:Uncharacterized protein n=1 Tax=Candidatus Giovannonibacteria bacterium RIFCSPHIGHO2_01_FULL_45_23 TaxID=1798325 RepID=A0A1F5VF62_9BACT|nr:MAG: hypothetical protein A2834_01930 [Candidatus Giovannonibacteria bacterium RIFCSPHIGHO2_01_FULL_45_23]OGF75062.1 MAG: hypothetical protein A3C77_04035 [Candidatus Giovannonibacteria bacterium RIFCSPHIGHO2_02_FULL_45_13]OGF80174.1 MAG: hypothetical protein A2926_03220 [Candidatus Giovannonibacteria bacterium RIFCSPLOWO2_01_FULL_44_40]